MQDGGNVAVRDRAVHIAEASRLCRIGAVLVHDSVLFTKSLDYAGSQRT